MSRSEILFVTQKVLGSAIISFCEQGIVQGIFQGIVLVPELLEFQSDFLAVCTLKQGLSSNENIF